MEGVDITVGKEPLPAHTGIDRLVPMEEECPELSIELYNAKSHEASAIACLTYIKRYGYAALDGSFHASPKAGLEAAKTGLGCLEAQPSSCPYREGEIREQSHVLCRHA